MKLGARTGRTWSSRKLTLGRPASRWVHTGHLAAKVVRSADLGAANRDVMRGMRATVVRCLLNETSYSASPQALVALLAPPSLELGFLFAQRRRPSKQVSCASSLQILTGPLTARALERASSTRTRCFGAWSTPLLTTSLCSQTGSISSVSGGAHRHGKTW